MNQSYFSIVQQLEIALGLILLSISVLLFEFTSNKNRALLFLLLGGFCIKLFMILLSPYLFTWDEVFHGLVAKNLIKHPLHPTLYDKTFFEHGLGWSNSKTWLHKQPWFLWQMALSIKIFGANAFAVRFPSLIYTVFSAWAIYDIGKKLAHERIGFYAAFFYFLNHYSNDQVSGRICLDQNDTIFFSLIIFSFWALINYLNTQYYKTKYIVLIGVFCGLAILTKWLVALVVFLSWAIVIILNNKKKSYNPIYYIDLLKSLVITAIVAVPWQIYTFMKFPIEAKYEQEFNKKHITEALEGHGGDLYFYYEAISQQYGYFGIPFFFLGLFLLHTYSKQKNMYYALIICVAFVFAFFTIANTKMPTYTMATSFVVFLGFGAIAQKVVEFLKPLKWYKIIFFFWLIMFFGISSLDIEKIQAKFTRWKIKEDNLFYMEGELQDKLMADYINETETDTSYVIFNAGFAGNINTMFCTNHIAYPNLPSKEDMKVIIKNKHKIALIDNGILPIEFDTSKQIKIYRTQNLQVIKRETFYLKSHSKGYLFNDNNKICTVNKKKTKFVFTFYKDGNCQIKTEQNELANIAYHYGGLILLDGKIFNSRSRFKLEFISKNTFRIKTYDNKYFKIINNGERIVTDKLIDNNPDYLFSLH